MKSRRVLLLAMSGVRVKSDELRRLGMTLPGFIERGQVIASLPSLSLLTLAAHTPENWEAEYREIDELTDGAASQIASAGYDIVAISALTARILDAYEIADQLREAGITVVLGASTSPRFATRPSPTRTPSSWAKQSCSGRSCSPTSKPALCVPGIRQWTVRGDLTSRRLRFPVTTCSMSVGTTGSRFRQAGVAHWTASSAERRD